MLFNHMQHRSDTTVNEYKLRRKDSMDTPLATKPVNGSKRPLPKTRTVSARVTEAEYAALQNHAWTTEKTLGDWARDSLLHQLETDGSTQDMEHHSFIELVGVQLLLMNTLGPLLRGERLTAEQLDSVFRQVQSIKVRKAQEILNKRLHRQRERRDES